MRSRSASSALPRLARAVVIGAIAVAGIGMLGSGAAFATDGSGGDPVADGIGLSFTVPGPPATSVGSSAGPVVLGSGGSSGAAATVTPQPSAAPPAADEFDLGGVLYLSGISSTTTPSINPLGGTANVWITVRNVSKTTFSSTAAFSLTGPVGNPVATTDPVDVTDLKPGETRVVSAELPGTGQWTVLTAHVTLTPPETVDGNTLTPVTRDATLLIAPWLVLATIGLAAAVFVVVRIVRGILAATVVGETA